MKKKLTSSHELIKPTEIDELFSQLTSQEVEQFYKMYHLWLKQQQITRVQQEIHALKEKQVQNAILLYNATPSAVALSALAQLRASGVEDVDLLDRMLERGEEWLDHTMQLLERCEELNVIRGNYTQWCEHALDGAYEWMGSMDDASLHDYFHAESASEDLPPQSLIDPDLTDVVTEDQLLRKLMSEDGNSPGRNTIPLPKITQELPPLATNEDEEVDSLDFPVEIEEPKTEAIESDINSAQQAQATAEQLADQENKQPDEQTAHIEEPFPVEIEATVNDAEIEESVSDIEVEEIVPDPPTDTLDDESVLLSDEPVLLIDQQKEAEPVEIEATVSDIEVEEPVSDIEVEAIIPDPPTDTLDDASDEPILLSDEPVLLSDEPVLLIDHQEEADPVEIEATTLGSSEHHDNIKDDGSTSTDMQIDEAVEPASLPSETSQNEEHPVLISDHTDIQLPMQEPDDIPEIIKDTTAADATDRVEANEEKSPDQWPFVYQEIEKTPVETATLDEAPSQESGSDAEQLSVEDALKKPQDEALSTSSTKKQSYLGHLLTGFLRR